MGFLEVRYADSGSRESRFKQAVQFAKKMDKNGDGLIAGTEEPSWLTSGSFKEIFTNSATGKVGIRDVALGLMAMDYMDQNGTLDFQELGDAGLFRYGQYQKRLSTLRGDSELNRLWDQETGRNSEKNTEKDTDKSSSGRSRCDDDDAVSERPLGESRSRYRTACDDDDRPLGETRRRCRDDDYSDRPLGGSSRSGRTFSEFRELG